MEIGRLLTAMITPFDENGDINYDMACLLYTSPSTRDKGEERMQTTT